MLLGLLATVLLPQSGPVVRQAVEDTYLDSQLPDSNFGRDGLLLAGPGNAILIRFPELGWLPPGQEPDTAVLTFHLVEQVSEVKLKSVMRMTSPWSEGADMRLPLVRPMPSDTAYRGGSTWNRRRYGPTGPKWFAAGAAGAEDGVPVTGVSAVVEAGTVVLTGLGPTVAEMAKNPSRNYGFRIEFESKASFFSGEGYGPGPSLSLTTKNVDRHGARLAVLSLDTTGDPNKPSGWAATVMNVGDSVATGVSATWRLRDEKKGATDTQQALAPGDTVVMQWGGLAGGEKGLPDVNPLSVEVQPGGVGGAPDPESELTVPLNGVPVKFDLAPDARAMVDAARGSEPELRFLQRAVAFVNDSVLGQSRATFAPDGCYERVRLVTSDVPAVVVKVSKSDLGTDGLMVGLAKRVVRSLSPYTGHWTAPPDSPAADPEAFGWLADTRDDSAWTPGLMLPNYPWGDPKPLQSPLPVTGLVSRAEVAALNSMVTRPVADRANFVPPMPGAAILQVSDAGGNPLSGAAVEIFPTVDGKLSTTAAYTATATSGGKLFLGPQNGKPPYGDLKPDGSNAWFFVRVTREFVTETGWLPAWELAVERARGNENAPTVELRFMIPSGQIKTDEDLAQGKAVTDSLDRPTAELNALVDANPQTALTVAPADKPYWFEIDLGRDRVIGAVEIETDGAPMDKFEIATIKTGQKPADAATWVREGAGALRQKLSGKDVGGRKVVTYTSTAVRARIVRVTYTAGREAKITGIRVRTLQQGG